MSRSFKKTPAGGITTVKSEKQDKRIANRRLRSRVRQAVREGDEVLPERREISDVWCFGKDGKAWYGDCSGKYRHLLRK